MDLGLFDRRQRRDFLPCILGDDRSHAATRRSERHLHLDRVSARCRLLDREIIDEAEVDDVNGNLRIETRLQRFPHRLFAKLTRHCRALGGGHVARDGRRVFARDAIEAAVRAHGDVAAERLHDEDLRAARERGDIAGRNERARDVPVEGVRLRHVRSQRTCSEYGKRA